LLEIEELDTGALEERSYENFRISTQPVKHTPHSLAYRVDTPQGRSFVYSGDTGFCDEVIHLARDTDLLILECSSPVGQELEGHLTPSLAGRIARQSGAKKLVLLHFYPEVLVGVGARLRDVRPHLLSPYNNLAEWWIPPWERRYRSVPQGVVAAPGVP